MSTVERIERGWPSHFICAHYCMFRRNTLLRKGNIRIIVSTVGDMRVNESSRMSKVGYNRYYEAAVFHAKKNGPYWNIDVQKNITSQLTHWAIWAEDINDLPDHVGIMANDLHEAAVAAMIGHLEAGTVKVDFTEGAECDDE